MKPPKRQLTQCLQDVRTGKPEAAESLLELAYSELGELARSHLQRERHNHTLQPTALVHEAWLKLGGHLANVEDRPHFFAIASQAMRRVLTDHARSRNRLKRNAGQMKVTLDESVATDGGSDFDFLELDDVLTQLSSLNERHARVVELRVFGGLTIAEAGSVLGVSHTTIENDWFMARAWLRTAMTSDA